MIRLLTIDDEVEFTAMIQNYFGPRGFEVFAANNGSAGLALALECKPDICLIDLKMPGKHGDEVLQEIKKSLPKTQCIMITASEGEGKTRQHLLDMGAFACFDKPLSSIRELHNKITEALA